jgi:purine-binding chemotaxis protein CheW
LRAPLLNDHDPALEEILEKRAERARASADAEQTAATIPVAEFSSGKDRYAIPLSALRAVLPLKAITPVPGSPVHVIGILRFQGQLITVVSLMTLLGVKGWRHDCAVLLVVELEGGHRLAIDCEHIPRIEAMPQRAVEQARSRDCGPVYDVSTPGLQTVGFIDLAALLAQGSGATHG